MNARSRLTSGSGQAIIVVATALKPSRSPSSS
jgi:hypothetical protein